MLIAQNKFDKSKSKYACNRCEKLISQTNRYSVYIGEGTGTAHKKWDLCRKCYQALERGINHERTSG